jgi:hypothetical protein
MFRKTIAVALTAIVSCLSCIAQTQGQPDKTASVKAQVQKIGISDSSVVRVKLKDGTEHRGYLSQIENESFTITDQATKKAASISYGDVRSLKVNGKGMSTGTKVLIGVGVGVAIVGGIIAYGLTHLKI